VAISSIVCIVSICDLKNDVQRQHGSSDLPSILHPLLGSWPSCIYSTFFGKVPAELDIRRIATTFRVPVARAFIKYAAGAYTVGVEPDVAARRAHITPTEFMATDICVVVESTVERSFAWSIDRCWDCSTRSEDDGARENKPRGPHPSQRAPVDFYEPVLESSWTTGYSIWPPCLAWILYLDTGY
jgi:hypothetical protein